MRYRTRNYTGAATDPATGETTEIHGTHSIDALNPPREDHRAIKDDLAKEGIHADWIQVGRARIS